jgi:hypothetical protein
MRLGMTNPPYILEHLEVFFMWYILNVNEPVKVLTWLWNGKVSEKVRSLIQYDLHYLKDTYDFAFQHI